MASNPKLAKGTNERRRSPTYTSSPASDGAIAPASDSSNPVYFFHDPATKHFSQWYMVDFIAPLPTRASIERGRKDTKELKSLLDQSPSSSEVLSSQPSKAVGSGPVRWHLFGNAEQYMMYTKAVLMEDATTAGQILTTPGNPRKCKGLGRQVKNFNGQLWEVHREHTVEEGNWWKFMNAVGTERDQMRERIVATGEREIVEASPFDPIWGIGFAAKDADQNRSHWGLNLLGKALVRIRERIREVEEVREESDT